MINIKAVAQIFTSVFFAELGDKTQIATLCFVASGTCGKWEVFIASSLALVLSTLIAVLVGAQLSRVIPPHVFKGLAGLIFIVMGGMFVYQALTFKSIAQ